MSNAFSKLGRQTDRPQICHPANTVLPIQLNKLRISPTYRALEPGQASSFTVQDLYSAFDDSQFLKIDFQGVDSVPPLPIHIFYGGGAIVHFNAPKRRGSHWLSATVHYPDGTFAVAYLIIRVRPLF
jgi:hypothetical protein